MSYTAIETSQRKYSYSPDDPAPHCSRMCGLLQARIIDALTGKAVPGRITFTPDILSTGSESKGDGMVGLVGIPRQVIPLIAMNGYKINLNICADGYSAKQLSDVNYRVDQRIISWPWPVAGRTVITLNDVNNLSEGEYLLVGPPGPTMRLVKLRTLGPGLNNVTIIPGLSFDYAIGDPVVPVVSRDFRPLDLGDIPLQPESS